MKSYLDIGFSKTFERVSDEKKIPYMNEFDVQSYIEGVSANLLQGGEIKSRDGKLTIDLEGGHITYNDGITENELI